MLSNIRKVSKGPLGPGLRLLALTLGLVVIVAACGGPETVAPALPDTESLAPAAPATESVSSDTAASAAPDAKIVTPSSRTPAATESKSVAPASMVSAAPNAEAVTLASPDLPNAAESATHAPTAPDAPDRESVTASHVAPDNPDTESVASATPDAEPATPAPIAATTPEAESVVSSPTVPAASDAQGAAPEPTQEHTTLFASRTPEHYGAGTPSVEGRIYDSDVVVRASLQSSGNGSLRFRAIEYLKGTGPVDVTVHASTSNRNTAWDDREAVLFLSLPEDRASSGATGSSGGVAAGEFVFTEDNDFIDPIYESGSKIPIGYTIDKRDPAWLPTEAEAGASGATGEGAGDPVFITDSAAATGSSQLTISLSDLRSKIAWVEGGEDVEGYDQCIRAMLIYKRYDRDWEAHYGTPWTPYQSEAQVSSGAGEGVAIYVSGPHREPGYHRFWLTGQDASLFKAQIVDDDEIALNGYSPTAMTARPLPSRVYKFFTHFQRYEYMPCNFIPDGDLLEWIVTVTAPDSAVHEAFFDPVTLGAAVGADAANGVLKPASFSLTDGGSTASLTKIAWESGRATVELDPSLSLADHHADFIALDGSVSLRLDFDDAAETVDGTKRTLAWNVCTRPWESGDLLMLRISSSGENLTGVTNDGPCN